MITIIANNATANTINIHATHFCFLWWKLNNILRKSVPSHGQEKRRVASKSLKMSTETTELCFTVPVTLSACAHPKLSGSRAQKNSEQ